MAGRSGGARWRCSVMGVLPCRWVPGPAAGRRRTVPHKLARDHPGRTDHRHADRTGVTRPFWPGCRRCRVGLADRGFLPRPEGGGHVHIPGRRPRAAVVSVRPAAGGHRRARPDCRAAGLGSRAGPVGCGGHWHLGDLTTMAAIPGPTDAWAVRSKCPGPRGCAPGPGLVLRRAAQDRRGAPAPSPGGQAMLVAISGPDSASDAWAVGMRRRGGGPLLHWNRSAWQQVPPDARNRAASLARRDHDLPVGRARRRFLTSPSGRRSPWHCAGTARSPRQRPGHPIQLQRRLGDCSISRPPRPPARAPPSFSLDFLVAGTGKATTHWKRRAPGRQPALPHSHVRRPVSGSHSSLNVSVSRSQILAPDAVGPLIVHWNSTAWSRAALPGAGSRGERTLGAAATSPSNALGRRTGPMYISHGDSPSKDPDHALEQTITSKVRGQRQRVRPDRPEQPDRAPATAASNLGIGRLLPRGPRRAVLPDAPTVERDQLGNALAAGRSTSAGAPAARVARALREGREAGQYRRAAAVRFVDSVGSAHQRGVLAHLLCRGGHRDDRVTRNVTMLMPRMTAAGTGPRRPRRPWPASRFWARGSRAARPCRCSASR